MYNPDEGSVEDYRKKRVKEYSEAFDKVSMVLFEHDPIGLNFDDNVDEYELEAGMVMNRFPKANNIDELATIIFEVFVECFDKELATRKREVYQQIAKEVWEIIKT
ncbi:MAG: hypothetical protein AB199_01425 [Parcubacteria bacterium C7867-004]|nr:MAG: hypothetical protein AB199_01425 [Parcubacteria bacterium C7867-004]